MGLAWDWRTVGFTPDPTGWGAVYLPDTPGGPLNVQVVVGWLLQAERPYDPVTFEDRAPPPLPATRRVVAAVVDDAELIAADASDNFWFLLRPGTALPSRVEIAAEVQRRAAVKASRASR